MSLAKALRFDAEWHDTAIYGGNVSSDEMKDSATLERAAADRIEQLEHSLEDTREGMRGQNRMIEQLERALAEAKAERDDWRARWAKEPVDPADIERRNKAEAERITAIVHRVADDLKRDAERYRWLREQQPWIDVGGLREAGCDENEVGVRFGVIPAALDAAIDAAMQEPPK